MDLKTYKIKYYTDADRTIVADKVEATTETPEQLLQHAHVIGVEEVKEPAKKGKIVKSTKAVSGQPNITPVEQEVKVEEVKATE